MGYSAINGNSRLQCYRYASRWIFPGNLVQKMSENKQRPNIDELDLKLIQELEVDAVQTITDLAEKVGTSRPTVRKKLQRLLDERIIRFIGMGDPEVMGYTITVVVAINAYPGQIRDVSRKIASFPSVQYLMLCTGRFGMMAWVHFRHPEEINDFAVDQIGRIEGVKDAEIMVALELVKVSHTLLSDSVHSVEQRNAHVKLNPLELDLIREVEKDPKQTPSQLAPKLGTSVSTVSRKLRKLRDRDIIRIATMADPFALGYHASVLIGIKVLPGKTDAVAAALASYRFIPTVNILAGRYDIVISARFKQTTDLSDFIRKQLGNIKGIRDTDTMVVMEFVKT